MGDISAEPSMEDILSSIKRIIAEEGEASSATRSRRFPRAAGFRDRGVDAGDVLELSDPVHNVEPEPIRRQSAAASIDPILSDQAAEASRGALDSLSRVVVRPEAQPASHAPAQPAATLEDMVREMLRPMLRDWLDAKLPGMVEAMVAREIARITQRR